MSEDRLCACACGEALPAGASRQMKYRPGHRQRLYNCRRRWQSRDFWSGYREIVEQRPRRRPEIRSVQVSATA